MGGGCLGSRGAQSEGSGRDGLGDGSWQVAGMWEAMHAVNKQLVESPMEPRPSIEDTHVC